MKKIIDARGLPCPQPVVLTKKGLEESDQVTTIVDNGVAVENVTKLAKSKGCTVQVEEKDEAYYLHISKSCTACQSVSENQGSVAVLITSSLLAKAIRNSENSDEKFPLCPEPGRKCQSPGFHEQRGFPYHRRF